MGSKAGGIKFHLSDYVIELSIGRRVSQSVSAFVIPEAQHSDILAFATTHKYKSLGIFSKARHFYHT